MFSRRSTLALLVMMLLIPISSGTAVAEEGTDPLSNFPPVPESEWYVYDVADVISNETEAEWEADLRVAHRQSGRLVRLVTIPSMCDFDERLHRGEADFRMCQIDWTFDECYECGYGEQRTPRAQQETRYHAKHGHNQTTNQGGLHGG